MSGGGGDPGLGEEVGAGSPMCVNGTNGQWCDESRFRRLTLRKISAMQQCGTGVTELKADAH